MAVEIQRNTRPTLHILKTWGTETVLKRPKKCRSDEKEHVN